jgi:HemY protein
MRRVLRILLVAIVVTAVVWWLASLPGEFDASLAGWRVSAPAPLALLGLALFVYLVHLLLRLLAGLWHLPRRLRFWRGEKARATGERAVSACLLALAAGEAAPARRTARRARRLLGDTPQTLLLAAEAARLADDDLEAERLYTLMSERPDAAFLGLRGLFRQAMAREDWNAAADFARRAEIVHPGGSWLRTERAGLAVRLGDWQQALALAGPGAPEADFAAAAAEAEGDPVQAGRLARRAWKANPALTPAALAYAAVLRRSGHEKRALALLRRAWSLSPHPDLAAFALAGVTEWQARLKRAEWLVVKQPNHPESHFLLAREMLAAGLTGPARGHVEAARASGMNERRLWLLLADIEAAERGDSEEGRLAQRDALRAAANADPDPAWRCRRCGTVHPRWQPACPACHAVGEIRWGAPQRVLLAAPAAADVFPPSAGRQPAPATGPHA